MDLSPVSRTAILTLLVRVIASEHDKDLLNDPMSVYVLNGLLSRANPEETKWITGRRRFYSNISLHDALAGVRRAARFDAIASRYIAANPGCTVINLGCGFDTRFWRIAAGEYRYIEIDLPQVVELKKEILKDQLAYELLGYSVLDETWIARVTKETSSRFLLLAEGLLMFLPQAELTLLFQRLAHRFTDSQFSFDMVPTKYLHGLWKLLLRFETKHNWQLDAPWYTGLDHPSEIEGYAQGLRLLGLDKGSAGPILSFSINKSPSGSDSPNELN